MDRPFKHGQSGYTHHKCKCDICVSAHTKYCAEHYLAHRPERLERQKIYRNSPSGKKSKEKYNSSIKRKITVKAYAVKNREKIIARRREWVAQNREAARSKYRQWRLSKIAKDPDYEKKKSIKYLYGIDLGTYNLMLDSQNGHCACCSTKPGAENMGRGLAVDHNHSTGKVRGLLCHKCNYMIGYAKEDRVRLLNAIDYLEKHRN